MAEKTPAPRPTPPSDIERNKKVMLAMLEAFNTGNTDIIPKLIHPEAQDNSSRPKMGGPEAPEAPNALSWSIQIEELIGAFPDGQYSVDTMVAEGDTVMLRWAFTGTQRGPLFGREATNKQVTLYGYEIDRFQRGQIIDHTDDDSPVFHLLEQLGWMDEEMLRRLGLLKTAEG
ncbi:MAG: ester cyclase [Chloroflexia bacterium]